MSNIDNDELVAGFEGDAEELTEEQFAQRQEAFNKRVKKQIAIMMSPTKFKDGQRADAARMLGEYGEPTSIPYLLKTYQSDKSKAVKQAAGESLGMLKALGNVLADDDPEMQSMGLEHVQNIILKNRLGKPARFSAGGLRRLSLLLILIAIVVGAVAFLIPQKEEDSTLVSLEEQITRTAAFTTPSATPTSNNPEVLLGYFRDAFTALDNDSRTLQAQLLIITRQQPQDCSVAFTPSAQYSTPDMLTSINQFPDAVTAYNAAEKLLSPIRTRFQESCASGQAIPRQEALTLSTQLVEAQKELVKIAPILGVIGVSVPATATLVSVPTNTPIPTETPIPTATIDPTEINNQILNMEGVLNDMTGPRGKATQLQNYWANVQAGNSGDCLQMPPPPVPGDVLVAPSALVVMPELQNATDSLNGALQIIRNSYTAFESGCNTDTLGQLVGSQIPAVQSALTGFTDAQTRLNDIRAQLR